MIRVVAIVAMLLGAHGVAEACKAKGKVLFRITTTETDFPAPSGDPPTELEIFATGAWRYVAGEAKTSGCLTKKHLKELKRSLGKARFKLDLDAMTCRALSRTLVLLSSPKRKKSVETGEPCGTPVDEWTQNTLTCARLVLDDPAPSRQVLRQHCRGY